MSEIRFKFIKTEDVEDIKYVLDRKHIHEIMKELLDKLADDRLEDITMFEIQYLRNKLK